MTWGLQNTQEEANEQIEYALSQGINFIDTAEMYAVHHHLKPMVKQKKLLVIG